jgi:hypothetical protein
MMETRPMMKKLFSLAILSGITAIGWLIWKG